MNKLSTDQIIHALKDLPGWAYTNEAIHKELSFDAYMDGIEFVRKLAIRAEEHNHHPDLVLGWCKVSVTFTTHDSDGVTENDIQMAQEVESIIND